MGGMSIQRQAIIWAVVITVFVLMLWLLKGILLPFVSGMAISFFLVPLSDNLEDYGLSLLAATATFTLSLIHFSFPT